MKNTLQEQSKNITTSALVDTLRDSALTKLKLRAHKSEIPAGDSILVLTNAAGVQTIVELLDKMVHPGSNNTLSSGSTHAEWKEAKRYLEYGDCMLECACSIRSIARYSNHLLNGHCVGSQDGKCELGPGMSCAWQLIIDKLIKLGQLDKLKKLMTSKNWNMSLMSEPYMRRIS